MTPNADCLCSNPSNMTMAQEPSPQATCTSDDCFDTPSPCRRVNSIENFPWSEEDTYYTKLFRAWDNLPIHDASTETGLLMELDHIISLFDNYIGHNDLGFRAWVRRHQLAMEIGLVETPTWPKLYILKGGKMKWQDKVWVSRYSFLVQQRDIIAKSRLQHMKGCKLEDKKRFFGLVNNYRKLWGQGDFPFLYVQIASFGTTQTTPVSRCSMSYIQQSVVQTMEHWKPW